MGVLQIGWFAVATFVAADFILKGLGMTSAPMTPAFIITGALWGLVMASIAAKGIQYVAKVGQILNWIPLLMLLVVLARTAGGVGHHVLAAGTAPNSFGAVTTILAIVIGFFATAGAAGTDIASNARNDSDVKWGGLVGVGLAVLVAGGLPLISVAGAHGLNLVGPDKWDYADVVQAIGGPLASTMFFLFAIASIPATCFCSFIAGNSFSTMIPGVPRISSSMAGAVVGIILAVTGVARESDRVFQYCRRFIRPDYRGDDRRLSAVREEVVGSARRHQYGWLPGMGRWIHRGDSAVPPDTGRFETVHTACRTV